MVNTGSSSALRMRWLSREKVNKVFRVNEELIKGRIEGQALPSIWATYLTLNLCNSWITGRPLYRGTIVKEGFFLR